MLLNPATRPFGYDQHRGMRMPFGGDSYLQKLINLFGGSIVELWPQNEASGLVSRGIVNGRNGVYSNVTLGAQGIGDGNTAASYNGTTSFNNIYSAGFWTAFNAANAGVEGSLLVWAKVSGVGVWTDTVVREIVRLRPNSTDNMPIIRRTATNNQLEFRYSAGGVVESVGIGSLSSVGWMALAMTWSKAAEEMKAYINGAQVGTTQVTLGVWSTVVDTINQTCIGSATTTPTAVWSGSIGPVLLLNRAATAVEIAQASTL